jgi:hypothetical protein
MESRRNLLINLKVLSKLRPHQRIDTTASLFSICSPTQSIWLSITRWWTGARRTVDIARIQTLYEKAITEVTQTDDATVILNAMKDSLVGLEHFKTTYEGDSTSVANIEYIIDVVSATLRRYGTLNAQTTIAGHVVQNSAEPVTN